MIPPPDTTWTIRRLLAWAQQDFQSRNIESPRLGAELLLGHCLGKTRLQLILDADQPLDTAELDAFRELVRRRRKSEPVAYLLGHKEFFGLSFAVDARVLIPRPDTETLVDVALALSAHHPATGRLLDLCTGSGCVALAFALRRPGWTVLGTDLSPEALEIARDNTANLAPGLDVAFAVGDLFAAVPEGLRFDSIVANPPYIPSAESLALDPGITDFEPRLALDGGADGLDLVRRIVSEAAGWLAAEGTLALEVGFDQSESVKALLEQEGFVDVHGHRDYAKVVRVVSGHRAR